jgi:YidC/Oxa1 family membrane protein insertase
MLVNDQNTQTGRVDYAPLLVPQPTIRRSPAASSTTRCASRRRRISRASSSARRRSKTSRDQAPKRRSVINFGMFSWLAVPLLDALKWVHGFIGNWGCRIVVLTLLINTRCSRCGHKSVVSMRKMQEIQPQMKAIQDRYAKYKVTDPERQKMNTEVMELYKAEGRQPRQRLRADAADLPVLFAFTPCCRSRSRFAARTSPAGSTTCRRRIPYSSSPIVMGIAQFWQTKMTPSTADLSQQRIMMFMPIMFTVMSLSFPSGLVIYWLVSTSSPSAS